MKRIVLVLVATALLAPATADAAFPGANGKIAFVRGGDIWTMNPDGTAQVNLTSSAATERSPNWSPDGTRIVFVRGNPIWGLVTMGGDGSGEADLGIEGIGPSWSPDGQKISFGFDDHCSPGGLWTVDADGTDATFVTCGAGLDGRNNDDTAWSPDGQRILFSSDISEYDIDSAPPTGPSATNLTDSQCCFDFNANWSPDSQKIAWDRDPFTVPAIWTMNPDGTGQAQLRSTGADPAWSPDGTRMAFVEGGSVKVMSSNGTGAVTLTAGDEPDWQPIPVNSYARPKGATPFSASFTIAHEPCTAPNRTHGSPLAFPSCASPQRTSAHLTVGTGDSNGLPARNDGYLKLATQVGVPGGPDDADVNITLFMDDVFTNALADYTGELRARARLQITDKDNTPHPGGSGAATTQQIPFDVIAACAAVPDPQEGSVCTVSTSADAIVPGSVKEGRRSVWQLSPAELYDGGADGDAHTPAGDTLFATQGLFIP